MNGYTRIKTSREILPMRGDGRARDVLRAHFTMLRLFSELSRMSWALDRCVDFSSNGTLQFCCTLKRLTSALQSQDVPLVFGVVITGPSKLQIVSSLPIDIQTHLAETVRKAIAQHWPHGVKRTSFEFAPEFILERGLASQAFDPSALDSSTAAATMTGIITAIEISGLGRLAAVLPAYHMCSGKQMYVFDLMSIEASGGRVDSGIGTALTLTHPSSDRIGIVGDPQALAVITKQACAAVNVFWPELMPPHSPADTTSNSLSLRIRTPDSENLVTFRQFLCRLIYEFRAHNYILHSAGEPSLDLNDSGQLIFQRLPEEIWPTGDQSPVSSDFQVACIWFDDAKSEVHVCSDSSVRGKGVLGCVRECLKVDWGSVLRGERQGDKHWVFEVNLFSSSAGAALCYRSTFVLHLISGLMHKGWHLAASGCISRRITQLADTLSCRTDSDMMFVVREDLLVSHKSFLFQEAEQEGLEPVGETGM
eukprot:c18797_g1_i4.p1 GENE.c18797_g1_i4~~c18797_g1_i4.p1  ORF type:complete len:558 (+),score=108.41 c18797_g1_i4:239-1675(+)